jgi:hypothetical protein
MAIEPTSLPAGQTVPMGTLPSQNYWISVPCHRIPIAPVPVMVIQLDASFVPAKEYLRIEFALYLGFI